MIVSLAVASTAQHSLAAPDIINIVYDAQCALTLPRAHTKVRKFW